MCQARDVSDTVTRLYYPQGEVRPIGNTKLYYATDHLGTVRDVLAAPNLSQWGARVAAYDYDAYGNPIRSAGRISVDFRYAGMFYHQASGVYLTHYRGYDPTTAKWLSRDPIEEEGGINLYGYVGGNPITYNDPTGECPWCVAAIIGGLVGGGLDLGFQLLFNGGNFSCVDWWEVGISAGVGAAFGGAGAVGGTVPKGVELTKSQLKSIKSLEKQIQKHQKKLDDFKANPTVRPGMENLPKDVIKKQQEARINHLETEINTFKKNIEKIKNGKL